MPGTDGLPGREGKRGKRGTDGTPGPPGEGVRKNDRLSHSQKRKIIFASLNLSFYVDQFDLVLCVDKHRHRKSQIFYLIRPYKYWVRL